MSQSNISPRSLLSQNPLLEGVTTTQVAAVDVFIARDFFSTDRFWLGVNFRRYLLPKIERNVPAATLRVHRLREHSLDTPIMAALGGRTVVETSLAYLAELTSRQLNGEDCVLLINGDANIFYIADAEGNLWPVLCHRPAVIRRWALEASPVGPRPGWPAGRLVLSC